MLAKDNDIAVSDCRIEQVGFVPTLSDGSPIVCLWGFSPGGKNYTVGQLRSISDEYWAGKTPPRSRLNELIDLEERRITKKAMSN